MERGDAEQVARVLLQLGVQEQSVINSFLDRIQFGALHIQLARQIQEDVLRKDKDLLNKHIQVLLEGFKRFDAVSRYAKQEEELHNRELGNLSFEQSLLDKELAESQQALATNGLNAAVKRRLSQYLLSTQKARGTLAERVTLEKTINSAIVKLHSLIATQAGLVAEERNMLNRIMYGDASAADGLLIAASALQVKVIEEKKTVIEPLNAFLKKKISADSVLLDTLRSRKGQRITMADLKEDLRSFTKPSEVSSYIMKLMPYAHLVEVNLNEAGKTEEEQMKNRVMMNTARYQQRSVYRSILEAGIMDQVTGLFNKQYFNNRLVAFVQMAETSRRSFSLILFDLDKFKDINDTYGHQAGDEVILALVAIVRANMKQDDFVARVGGEEFAILISSDESVAFALADRLRKVVESEMEEVARSLKINRAITVSMGVATYHGQGAHLDADAAEKPAKELFKAADAALYESKHSGRNKVSLGTSNSESAVK